MAPPAPPIDPTKAAKYPVILSDALLGKPSKETYTGIRYNHKPTLSSESAPETARLKKSAKDGVFNLGFEDQGGIYQYSGSRTSEDGKYVLIFDPIRKAFILHRVDSLFHMNLAKTPTDGNVESLRKQFPHLEVTGTGDNLPSSSGTKQSKAKAEKPGAAAKATATKGKAAKGDSTAAKPKADKSKAEKNKPVALTLPSADAAKAATPTQPPTATSAPEKKSNRRQRSPVDSEEDESDIDVGLTIEYPGGPPSTSFNSNHFSPAFPATRRFSEFVRTQEDEDEDGENDGFDYGEGPTAHGGNIGYEEVEEEGFKLPSPVKQPAPIEQPLPVEIPERFEFNLGADSDEDDEVEMVDVDAEADPTIDLDEEELLKEFNQGGDGNESDISEEE